MAHFELETVSDVLTAAADEEVYVQQIAGVTNLDMHEEVEFDEESYFNAPARVRHSIGSWP